MKIEQKIETGGISKTNTPMLKFRINRPLVELVSTALHIEQPWAKTSGVARNATAVAKTTRKTTRCRFNFNIKVLPQPALPGAAPETYNADPKIESYRGTSQTTDRYRLPASAPK